MAPRVGVTFQGFGLLRRHRHNWKGRGQTSSAPPVATSGRGRTMAGAEREGAASLAASLRFDNGRVSCLNRGIERAYCRREIALRPTLNYQLRRRGLAFERVEQIGKANEARGWVP